MKRILYIAVLGVFAVYGLPLFALGPQAYAVWLVACGICAFWHLLSLLSPPKGRDMADKRGHDGSRSIYARRGHGIWPPSALSYPKYRVALAALMLLPSYLAYLSGRMPEERYFRYRNYVQETRLKAL